MAEVHRRILRDPEVRLHYDELRIRDEIGLALAGARRKAGLTQAEVASRAQTTQSVIARLEGCRGGIPSLPLLDRIARAVGLHLSIVLEKRRAA
jgi:transcriptional regulator with XRE-family HTH domain